MLGFILFFFRFGSATHCSDKNDCDQWSSESCCSDGVCRRNCYYCSYDFQCGTGEKCCDGGDCLSSCPTTSPWTYPTLATLPPLTYTTEAPSSYCTFDSDCELDDVCCDGDCLTVCPSSWSGGSIVGAIFGTIAFFSIIFSFVSCYFCAWCPYYRYRSPGAVIVSRQVPYQPFVTTTHTTMTQNIPPPPNYNQPPPVTYNQSPPPGYDKASPPYNPEFPQQQAQYPPVQGQPPKAPPLSSGEPVKY